MGYVIPQINAAAWLLQAADFFITVFNAIFGVPVLRFFLGLLLFALIVSLFVYATRTAGK